MNKLVLYNIIHSTLETEILKKYKKSKIISNDNYLGIDIRDWIIFINKEQLEDLADVIINFFH